MNLTCLGGMFVIEIYPGFFKKYPDDFYYALYVYCFGDERIMMKNMLCETFTMMVGIQKHT